MPQPNRLPLADSAAGRRAYDRRVQRSFDGWISSRIWRKARQRREAGRRRPEADEAGPGGA